MEHSRRLRRMDTRREGEYDHALVIAECLGLVRPAVDVVLGTIILVADPCTAAAAADLAGLRQRPVFCFAGWRARVGAVALYAYPDTDA